MKTLEDCQAKFDNGYFRGTILHTARNGADAFAYMAHGMRALRMKALRQAVREHLADRIAACKCPVEVVALTRALAVVR